MPDKACLGFRHFGRFVDLGMLINPNSVRQSSLLRFGLMTASRSRNKMCLALQTVFMWVLHFLKWQRCGISPEVGSYKISARSVWYGPLWWQSCFLYQFRQGTTYSGPKVQQPETWSLRLALDLGILGDFGMWINPNSVRQPSWWLFGVAVFCRGKHIPGFSNTSY